MDNERFTLKPARKRDFWVATDNDNGISITFREHDFNNSQEVNLTRGDTSMSVDKATKIATYLREIADWLRKEHYDIAMPSLLVQRERIGQAIRSFRQQRGMTQQELADAAGVTRPNLVRIEAGKYSVGFDILSKLAYALGVEIELR